MESGRSWMYSNRFLPGRKGYTQKWEDGVDEFISFAVSHPETMSGLCIRCPCRKCKNLRFKQCDEVRVHLYKWGFNPFYLNWTAHGEPFNVPSDSQYGSCSATYARGSISMSAHREQMKERDPEKKDPGLFKVLQATHKMKNGKYVSKRCEEVATRISVEIEEQTQQDDGIEAIDELAIISTASSGRRRDRVFGLESEQCVIPGCRQPGVISPIDITQTPQFNEQVQKMIEEENARRDAKYERKLERIKRRQRVEMEAQRAALEADRAQLEIICRSLNLPCPSAQPVSQYPDDSDSEDEEIVGTS